MITVATLSVGAIAAWAARWSATERQLDQAALMGRALARVLAPAVWQRSDLSWMLRNMVGDAVRHIEVVDASARPIASAGPRFGREEMDSTLVQVLQLEEPRARLLEHEGQYWVQVSAPLRMEGRVAGAVRMDVLASGGQMRWPVLFWVLMGVDGMLLVLFVGYVLTRYVVRPVERVQQAALQVARGDLTASVEPSGAAELTSLAESFNTMTAHLRDQLERLRRQREEIVATREQVVRAEKLASVGRLAAGVAHEVGNPLQSIIGFSEILNRGGLGEPARADFVSRLKSEAERIHVIVRQLLDYARPVDDAVEAVDLESVVDLAQRLVGPQRRLREVRVVRRGLERLPETAASPQRLVQVLVNLLLNAADAIADAGGEGAAGTVTITGDVADSTDEVQVRVSNTGKSIPPGDRERVFDPFFTTKEPGHGTGLGLSVAQSIVESFGGRLFLADDALTTFVISLRRWSAPEG